MATVAIPQTITSRHSTFALTIGPALAAGLMVGTAECLFFAYALARTPIDWVLFRLSGSHAFMDGIDAAALVLLSLVPIGAGAAFARLTHRHIRWWRLALAGVILLVTSLAGVVIAGFAEQFADTLGIVRTFQVAFMAASATGGLLGPVAVAPLL